MKFLQQLLTSVFIVFMVSGCVRTVDGQRNPLSTPAGREAAIQAHIELAMGYVGQGMTEQAKAPLLEALAINPNDANVNAALAYVFQIEGETTTADEYFQRALVKDPTNARILNNYGAFLFSQKRYQEAKVIFIRASEDNFYSERSMVFENLGLVSLQLNNIKDAEHYFQRSQRLNNLRPIPAIELARLYYNQGNYQMAKSLFDKFVALVGDQQGPDTLSLGVNIYTAVNDKASATRYKSILNNRYPNFQQSK